MTPAASPQAELDNGASIAALRRFNDNLANLTAENWGAAGPGAGREAARVWAVAGAPPKDCSQRESRGVVGQSAHASGLARLRAHRGPPAAAPGAC